MFWSRRAASASRTNLKSSSGFTLIELMVVVTVMGVLATLAISRYGAVTGKVKKAEAPRILKQIMELEIEYYEVSGEYVPSVAINNFGLVDWQPPSYFMRYNYTARAGPSGDVKVDLDVVATEIDDADGDGNFHEEIIMTENGLLAGDVVGISH